MTTGARRRRRSPAASPPTFANKNVGTGKTVTVVRVSISTAPTPATTRINFVHDTTGEHHRPRDHRHRASDTKTYDGTTSSAATPTVTGGSARRRRHRRRSRRRSTTRTSAPARRSTPAGIGRTTATAAANYTITFVNDTDTATSPPRAMTVTAHRREQGLRRHHDRDGDAARRPDLRRRVHGCVRGAFTVRQQERRHRQDRDRHRHLDLRHGRGQLHAATPTATHDRGHHGAGLDGDGDRREQGLRRQRRPRR